MAWERWSIVSLLPDCLFELHAGSLWLSFPVISKSLDPASQAYQHIALLFIPAESLLFWFANRIFKDSPLSAKSNRTTADDGLEMTFGRRGTSNLIRRHRAVFSVCFYCVLTNFGFRAKLLSSNQISLIQVLKKLCGSMFEWEEDVKVIAL